MVNEAGDSELPRRLRPGTEQETLLTTCTLDTYG